MEGGQVSGKSHDIHGSKRNKYPKLFSPPLPTFFAQIPQKIQNYIKLRLRKSTMEEEIANSAKSGIAKEKGSNNALEVNLEKQLQAWKENPTWVDLPPDIKVSVPKGSFCNLNVKLNAGLPPDAIYDIVIDPDNRRVFKNIKEVISRKVLLDDGVRQVVEVEQAAIWRFLWWSGTISVHVVVDQNRKDYSVKFTQGKTGFMKRFEGCWKVQPLFVDEELCFPFKPKTLTDYNLCSGGKGRVGSIISLQQLIQPALIPPPPISWYLRGITTKTTEMLITDLLEEVSKIRSGTSDEHNTVQESEVLQSVFDEHQADEVSDIKERWARRRRIRKQRKSDRRLR